MAVAAYFMRLSKSEGAPNDEEERSYEIISDGDAFRRASHESSVEEQSASVSFESSSSSSKGSSSNKSMPDEEPDLSNTEENMQVNTADSSRIFDKHYKTNALTHKKCAHYTER